MTTFDVAAVQGSAISPSSYETYWQTCAANVVRVAETIESLMTTPAPPRVIALGAQPFSGGSATARAGWDQKPPVAAIAIDLRGDLVDPLIAVCRRHGCYVGGSVFESVSEMPGRFFHTGFILGPHGLALRSPKAQARSAPEVTSLRDIAEEYEAVFGPGSICPVIDTPYGRLACVVEKEIYAPEVGRLLAARGAEIVLHPSAAWVTRHPEAKRVVGSSPEMEVRRVSAFTNGYYLLTAHESRVYYPEGPRWSHTISTITGPDGSELARIGPGAEGVAIGEVDLEWRKRLRSEQASRWTSPAEAIVAQLAIVNR